MFCFTAPPKEIPAPLLQCKRLVVYCHSPAFLERNLRPELRPVVFQHPGVEIDGRNFTTLLTNHPTCPDFWPDVPPPVLGVYDEPGYDFSRFVLEKFCDSEVVLDPFSGPLGAQMALDLGLKAVVIESEEAFCETLATL